MRSLILNSKHLLCRIIVASVFSVFAEETAEQVPAEEDGGLLASLFGEGGLLEELLAEVTQEDAAEETASDEMAQEDGEAGIDLSGLLDTLQRGAEGFSLDALDELLGQYMGGEDDGDSSGFDFDRKAG